MKNLSTKLSNPSAETLLHKEWLATNGLGGYACGSLCGIPMRKYHGLLIAALNAPHGRTVMLNYVADSIVTAEGKETPLSRIRHVNYDEGNELADFPLTEFRLENGFPIWHYEFDGIVLEKSLFLVHSQNTVYINYRLLSSPTPVSIKWRPYLHFRNTEQAVNQNVGESYQISSSGNGYEINSPSQPTLRLYGTYAPSFTIELNILENVFYEMESKRGYESVGNLTSPGYFTNALSLDKKETFIASTEAWPIITALLPIDAERIERRRRKEILKLSKIRENSLALHLVMAADQFIITPSTRVEDVVRLKAEGEEARSIVAGYPWFTEWGRDTMISLEGLVISTRRFKEAYSILRTFAHYVKEGLIPNMFPDGEKEGIYNTVDATLWFFHATDRYIEATGDDEILEFLLPQFVDIVKHHIRGTRFGIKMDEDGLLSQGQDNLALTWMDAKMGDWVVTPRRGKPVEINALWYNALKLLEKWTGKPFKEAEKCYESFNQKFWFKEGGYLYDVIEGPEGNDSALRPNQLFAISLSHPVLEPIYWSPVVDAVKNELLTSVGLRTLSRSHEKFQPHYKGNLLTRDTAYHQGTIWPWLLGAFTDAWLKTYPTKKQEPLELLMALENHLGDQCLGTIGEIFDATDPYHSRGCFAQAWSVAELLRSLIKVDPSIQQNE